MRSKKILLGHSFVEFVEGTRYTVGYCASNSGADVDGYLLINNMSKYRFKSEDLKSVEYFDYDGNKITNVIPDSITTRILENYNKTEFYDKNKFGTSMGV